MVLEKSSVDPLGTRKINKWVLEQITPEDKMTQQKLSYFEQIVRRQGSLEKTVMLGQVKGIQKKGNPNMR